MALRIQDITKKLLDPLIWAGIAAMVVGGGWLVMEDQWRVLWAGGMGLVASRFIFPFLMIPAGFCAGVMMVTEKRWPVASRIFAALSVLWMVTLLVIYPVTSLTLVGDALEAGHVVPAIIWALAAGITPWAFFATRDRASVFFTGLVLMSTLVGAVLFPLAAEGNWRTSSLIYLYWLILAAMVGIEALFEKYFFVPPPVTEPAAENSAEASAADTAKGE